MSIVTYNNRSIRNVTSIPGAAKSLTLIKTLTADEDANLSFVNGTSDVVLDSTYPIYLFKIISMHPQTDNVYFRVNFRDGGSSYDATKTSTTFFAYQNEAGNDTGLSYATGPDLAQATGAQRLTVDSVGNGNDETLSGEMYLFNPSSTTFVKHFLARTSEYHDANTQYDSNIAGYCNVTAAIDAVQFVMDTGNIYAGDISLYGIL